MTSPTGSERNIQYPLNRTEDTESETPSLSVSFVDLLDWSTNNPDERVDIVMNMSLNEYVALATCVDVGRDIAYGDNSIYLWWLWCRALTAMDICDSIVGCIENSETTRDAIQNAVSGLPDAPGELERINASPFSQETCLNDEIYGYCLALWEYINNQNIDFLQQASEATNRAGLIKKLITLIPGADQLPIDEALEWVEQFGNYNLEAYESSLTTAIEQEIVCDLFCIARDECTITFEQVYDYFIDKLGGVNAPTAVATFGEWMIFMATGSYPSDRVVYLWSAFQLALAFVGQEFLGLSGVTQYGIQAQAGDPSDAWEVLCTECPTPWSIDYLDGSGDPSADGWIANFGAYDSGNDWYNGTTQTPSSKGVQLEYTVGAGLVVELSSWTFRYSIVTSSPRTQRVIVYDELDNVLVDDTQVANGASTGTVSLQSPITLLEGYRIVAQAASSIPPNATCRITEMHLSGDGDNPFE